MIVHVELNFESGEFKVLLNKNIKLKNIIEIICNYYSINFANISIPSKKSSSKELLCKKFICFFANEFGVRKEKLDEIFNYKATCSGNRYQMINNNIKAIKNGIEVKDPSVYNDFMALNKWFLLKI